MALNNDFKVKNGLTVTDSISAGGNLSASEGFFDGDVGIGTYSPTDKLDVAGALRLTSNISFDANKSGRIYKASNHGLAIHGVTGSTNDFAMFTPAGQLMLVNPSGTNNVSLIPVAAGNVGIGEVAPEVKLEVAGDIMAKDSFVSVGMGASDGYNFHDLGTTWGYKALASPSRLAMFTDGAERITIDQNGNVGIGTTSPDAILEISDATNDNLRIGTRGGNMNLFSVTDAGAASPLAFEGSQFNFITGNVGIGTASPSSPLHISGSDNVLARFHSTDASATLYLSDNSTSNFSTFKRVSDNLAILENGGNVGIGDATPSYKLDVAGDINSQSNILSGGVDLASIFCTSGGGGTGTVTSVTAGAGMTQTGTSTIDPTLNVIGASNGGICVTTDAVCVDSTVVRTTGAQSIAGAKCFTDTVRVAGAIEHLADSNTCIQFTNDNITLYTGGENHIGVSNTGVVINEGGATNYFRVEGDTDANLLYVDGPADKVGIGTASPGGKLDIAYSGTGGTGTVGIGDGLNISSLNPNITFNDNSATVDNYAIHLNQSIFTLGRYLSATSQTPDLVLKSGNVGIGTTNPTRPLEIYKTGTEAPLQVRSNLTTYTGIGFRESSGAGSDMGFVGIKRTDSPSSSDSEIHIRNSKSGTVSTSMMIDTSGNVGIGTTNPQAALDLGNATNGTALVWGGASGTAHYNSIWSEYSSASLVLGAGLKPSTSSGDFIFPFTGTYGYAAIELDSFSDDGIKFYTAADAARTAGSIATKQERVRINTAGDVGIGATSPTNILHTYTSSNTVGRFESSDSDAHIRINDNSDSLYVGTQNQKGYIGSTTANSINNLTIDLTNGNVGIGTTSPSFTSGGGLQITNANQANLRLSDSSDASYNLDLAMSQDDFYLVNRSSTGHLKFRVNNSTEAITVIQDGNVGIGTTDPTAKLTLSGAENAEPLLFLGNKSNAGGASIQFTDAGAATQLGGITFRHADSQSQGGSASFSLSSTETDLALIVGSASNSGRVVVKSGGSPNEVQYGFYDDINTGVYRPSNHMVGLVANGTERIRVESTGSCAIGNFNTTGEILSSGTDISEIFTTCTGTGNVDTTGTPVDNDFAKFTDANTIEGRSCSEVRSDLGIGTAASCAVGCFLGINAKAADSQNLDGIDSTQFLRSDATDTANCTITYCNGINFTNGNVRLSRDGNRMYIAAYEGWRFYDTQGGANRMCLTSVGNLGIGCTAPTQKLAVAGDGLFTSNLTVQGSLSVTGAFTCLDTTISVTSAMDITNHGTGPALLVNQTGSNDIVNFQDDGTSAFYIEDGGNVGIGCTNPVQKLDVNGRINTCDAYAIDNSIVISSGKCFIGAQVRPTTAIADTYIASAACWNTCATSAQGTLATNALPKAGGTMTGNIHFNDSVKANFGGSDSSWELEIYANSSNDAYIDKTATSVGDLIIQNQANDSDIIFKSDDGSGGITPYFKLDGSSERLEHFKNDLHYDNVRAQFGDSADLQIYHNGTNSLIDNYTGSIILTNNANDKDILFQSDRGDGNAATYFYLDGSLTNNSSILGATRFPDKSQILMGTGGDLQIYHDGSNSYISETGTGSLIVNTDAFLLKSANNGEFMMTAYQDGAVNLYHNNASKLQTTSAGINVCGTGTFTSTVNATQLCLAGSGDTMIDLNQTGTDTGWSYINFKTLGTRNYYVGQDNSKNFNIYNDNIDVTAISVGFTNANVTLGADLIVNGGDITLGGTGRIQGIDTVSSGTDAANKTYVDNAVSGCGSGTVTSIATTGGITGGTITSTGTLSIDSACNTKWDQSGCAGINCTGNVTTNTAQTITGTKNFCGDICVGSKILHTGDSDTYFQFGNNVAYIVAGNETVLAANASEVVINEPGNSNDFRVESDTNTHMLFVDGSANNIGINCSTPTATLAVNGSFVATCKSFLVDNPVTGGQLKYGVVEGNEHGVTVRGSTCCGTIDLPAEWDWLVHEDSVTAQITPVGSLHTPYIVSQDNKQVVVCSDGCYNYNIYGTRKDVEPLEVNIL